jgi:hypothetical protein
MDLTPTGSGARLVTGIHRAVFGPVNEDAVADWLARHVRRHLAADVQSILFQSGRVAAVYGLRLSDGTEIVAKVHRRPVNIGRLAAATACQRILADHGFPCPRPLAGPAITDGRVAVLESRLDRGEPGDAHQPELRRAMARALAEQVDLLRARSAAALAALADPPAWAAYERGPWPMPHDPIFDFTTTPAGFEWLDRLAQQAAEALGPRPAPDAIGHSDWECQNVRFSDGQVSTAYDWDSLLAHSEPILAGLAAGAHPSGGIPRADAPTPDEVTAFLADYDECRATAFTRSQQTAAVAAATWRLAYNARCVLSAEALGYPPAEGSALHLLSRFGHTYLAQRW